MTSVHSTENIDNDLKHYGNHITSKMWRLLIWFVVISSALQSIGVIRDFDSGADQLTDKHASIVNLIPLFGRLMLFTLGFYIIYTLLVKYKFKPDKSSLKLWIYATALGVIPIISTITAERGVVRPSDFTMLIIFTATYLLLPADITWLMREIRYSIITVYIYGSLLSVFIAPHWAMETDYETNLSIIAMRLYGLAGHANSLAPLIAIVIILRFYKGTKIKYESIHMFFAILALLLTQSKTTWICLFVVIIFQKFFNIFSIKPLFYKIKFFLFTSSITFICYLTFNKVINKYLADKASDPEIMTLTGRIWVWFVTVEAWLQKPFLGIGTTLWDSEMRFDYERMFGAIWSPNTAHNQFLQTLGTSGIIGFIFLLLYLGTIFHAAWRLRKPTKWISVSIFMFFLLRSFTEVWVRLGPDANFVLSWLLFAFSLVYIRNNIYTTTKLT